MKKKFLALLLAGYIALATPWKLAALMVETFYVHPGLTRMTQTHTRYWDVAILKERIEALGYTVKFTKDLTMPSMFQSIRVYGLTEKGGGKASIQVDEGLSWDMRYDVLAHEGGHIFQSERYSEEESEAFAEAVATIVTHNGLREHARYLASHKLALFTVLLLDSAKVYRAAAVLTE
jgi:hypothetical protein